MYLILINLQMQHPPAEPKEVAKKWKAELKDKSDVFA